MLPVKTKREKFIMRLLIYTPVVNGGRFCVINALVKKISSVVMLKDEKIGLLPEALINYVTPAERVVTPPQNVHKYCSCLKHTINAVNEILVLVTLSATFSG